MNDYFEICRRLLCMVRFVLVALVCMSVTMGNSSTNTVSGVIDFEQASTVEHLSDQQIEWLFAGPNGEWAPELLTLARLLGSQQYHDADSWVDAWIERDFNQAFAALPALSEFIFVFEGHSVAPVYARHLDAYEGAQRIELLAMLNLSHVGVRYVAVSCLVNWWEQDPADLRRWIQQTPCLFEESYYEDFLKAIQPRETDPSALASLFLSLDLNDERRSRFFDQVIQDWMTADADAAIAYIDTLCNACVLGNDPAVDLAASKISYYFASRQQYVAALGWAAKVGDSMLRELAVRDHSLGVTVEIEKQLFIEWLEQLPFESLELRMEIDEQLSAVGDGAVVEGSSDD